MRLIRLKLKLIPVLRPPTGSCHIYRENINIRKCTGCRDVTLIACKSGKRSPQIHEGKDFYCIILFVLKLNTADMQDTGIL